jgi:hypothetical protein
LTLLLLFAAASCKSAPQQAPAPSPSGSAAASSSASAVVAGPSSAAVSTLLDAGTASAAVGDGSAAGSLALVPWTPDGGVGCRLLRGPIELPLKAPAALVARAESLDAVLDDDGKPRTASFPITPVPPPTPAAAAPSAEPASGGAGPGYAVPCGLAGDYVFCADRTGAVHRTARDGSGDRIVGSSRVGSRIAAASLAGTHTTLGYLASRQTSEGWVSEAWLVVDDTSPLRLSEDGSGATSLALAQRGSAVLALTVDARAALTAMHARPVTYEGGAAHLGEDAVVFVGGPGDRRTHGALLTPPSQGPTSAEHDPAWALLPIAKDVGSFGLALVRLDDPPHVDEPVSWSMYENGLDPAPVAGATAAGHAWAARVVPRDASPTSARQLELGSVGPSGSFTPHEIVPTSGKPSDVSLTGDAHGALWLAWVDGAGSWLERLVCPAATAPLPGH